MRLLNFIKEKRVFGIHLSNDKKEITFWEECDNYFEVNLNKEQLKELIDEFKIIYESMENSK